MSMVKISLTHSSSAFFITFVTIIFMYYFLDIIHSDAGGLGKSEPIGDAGQMNKMLKELIYFYLLLSTFMSLRTDFFPNGIVPLMPGCLTIFCSHSRCDVQLILENFNARIS